MMCLTLFGNKTFMSLKIFFLNIEICELIIRLIFINKVESQEKEMVYIPLSS